MASLHAWLVTYPLVLQASSTPSSRITLAGDPSQGSYHLDQDVPVLARTPAHRLADLVRRYPVDGVHFDYFRYPEGAEQF